ncbi:60S ribosomal protein L14 [Nowakowskiella sp. JEL0407]|nr:60S ribosomal protein L14 [Nowakowskiella sp. JEL0407]
MVFKKFVEVGRVVLITYGEDAGKLAVVVDIVDHNRVLIDGPTTGVTRQSISFKRLSLTPLVVKIPALIGSKALSAVVAEEDIVGKFGQTAWAKKIQIRKTRAELSDFNRFQLMVAKKERRAIVGKEFAKLRTAYLKSGK